jgi:antitoxin component YwqK of YwqJK toxin-antitoxin module
MKILFTCLFTLSILQAFAQKQNVYYLKNSGIEVALPDSADYTRIVREPDSGSVLYKVFEYYKTKKVKFLGTSSTIYPLTLEGLCINYYANGKRKNALNYHKGKLTGAQFYNHPNGRLFQELLYANTNPDNPDGNYQIITVADSAGAPLVTAGNGYYKRYNETYTFIAEEGFVKNGLRDSLWKGIDQSLKLTFSEKYKLGHLIEGTFTDSLNKKGNYSENRIIPLQYKDGVDNFYRFINRNLRAPMYSNSTRFEVSVQFIVNPNKTLSNFQIIKSGGKELNDSIIKLCKSTAVNWIPEKKYGIPVPAQFKTVLFVISRLP